MALIARIISADGSKSFTVSVPAISAKLAVPKGAKVELIDTASQKVLPAAIRKIVDQNGEEQDVLVVKQDGVEQALVLEDGGAWPVANDLAMAPVADEAPSVEAEELDVTRASSVDADSANGAAGVSAAVLYGLLGVAGIGGGIAVASSRSDRTAPAAPTGLDLASADDSGSSNSDNITSQTSALTIAGVAEANAKVELFDGTTSIGTATAGADGNFSADVTLTAGTHSITAKATDKAGNTGTASAALSITVDTGAPAAPGTPDLATADDTGASSTDNLTSQTSGLTVTGTAEANAKVELFDGTTSLGTTTANASGAYSLDVALGAGAHSITAKATDAAGNVSAASAALAVTVDTSAPVAPTGLDLAAADDSGASSIDNVTDNAGGLTISGTAEANATVELFDGTTSLGTTAAGANGIFTLDVALAAGTHNITARATDAAGNAGAASSALTITVGAAPVIVNSSVDGLGDHITLYFSEALDSSKLPALSQFAVDNNGAKTITRVQVVNNQAILDLSAPLDRTKPVKVSFTDASVSNDAVTLQDKAGNDVATVQNVDVTNWLVQAPSQSASFAPSSTITLAGAEISAFDPVSKRLFVTSFSGLQVVQVDAKLGMTLLGTISLGSNDVNSVTVKNGIVAVAVAAADMTLPGSVYFLDAKGTVGNPSMVLGNVQTGALPDMVTFTADGKQLLVANEGEQDTAGKNPVGSVTIIDIANGVANATVKTATFDAFNSRLADLKAAGVRLFAGNTGFETVTVAQDLEPEYISLSPDGKTALVTLQENNAVAVLDIATGTFIDIVPLGLKSFLGLPFDGSDRDGAGGTAAINLQTDQPVFGQYMPDSIASFTGADGKAYYAIANEGDDRDDFITPDETARLSTLTLDPTLFPNAAVLKTNAEIGRLTVSNAPGNNGDTDKDGDIDQILAYGARSFSILDAQGNLLFDSASHIEMFVSARGLFTTGAGTGLFDDTRSDNKSAEPEGLVIGKYGNSTLAFVALERGGGGVMVYDVTDPKNVTFVQYMREFGDISPEGLLYVPAADSPSGEPLLIASHEVSNTVTIFSDGSAAPVAANDAFPINYLTGVTGRAAFEPIITSGDTANNGYVFNGIPDGVGVIDQGDGTLRVLVNHEMGATNGTVRAHGSKGAYVSDLIIDKATLTVVSGQDFLSSANNLYMWNGTTWTSGTTTAFNRFCSADLASATAFRTATAGYNGRLFLTGEEAGTEGRAFAHVVTGAEAGRVYELPSLGNLSYENIVANHVEQAKTVVVSLDDVNAGQVYFYVGTKSTTGNAVEQAGLAGGTFYGVKVGATALATEVGALATPTETGLGLVNGTSSFSLVSLGDVTGKTGAEIETASNAAGVTQFLRPEDGAWSLDGKTFYFVTTASPTTASRLWALEFTNAANPEAGGTVRLLLDGSEGQVMFDNMTVADDGTLILQEDPGSLDRLAKIWKYEPATDRLTEIAQHNADLFSPGGITIDEESSGVVDVTRYFTGIAGYDTTKYNYFMVSDQIHKNVTAPASVVQMGQLSIMATPKTTANPDLAFPASNDSYLVGVNGRSTFNPIINAGQAAGNGYVFNGIPDGVGVIDNGNGTFRMLVNHEMGATVGIVRAHGSKGAYVSDLTIDKATMTVISGQDFLQSANDLYMWNGTSWTSGTTTAFNRFCSADLADLTAFRTATAGYNGRIYLTGEEAGVEGRAFAHILTGAEAGRVYELPSLGNLSFENAVANHLEQAKTVVVALDDVNAGQVYFYVGNKGTTGNAVEQAGLAGGTFYGVKVGATALATEVGALATPTETGLGLVNGTSSFSLVSLGDVTGKTGAEIETASNAAGVTQFLRPEDGAWSLDGKSFYFVTTASPTTASRLWALEFTNAANPEAGGTIRMLLDGSEGQMMFDNLTVSDTGRILLQEDPGNNARLAKIWSYDVASDSLVAIGQHNPALFSTGGLTIDEESSGIVDVTSMFTNLPGYDTSEFGYFLIADQIHAPLANPAGAVEYAQLSLMATSYAFA